MDREQVTGTLGDVARPTAVCRSVAQRALQRAVDALRLRGVPVVLGDTGPRLVLTDVTWSPHRHHPAARHLLTLRGHVQEAGAGLLAAVEVRCAVDSGSLVLHGTSPDATAAPALREGLRLLAAEIEGWGAVVDTHD